MNFKDKVVVITGGTGALGSAVTSAFLQAGAKVFVTYRSEQEFDALKASVNAHAALTGIKTNVLDEASVKAMVQQAARFGRIEMLVNLVGGYLGGVPVTEMSVEQWDKMIDLNLKSAFLCCKHVLPVMMQQNVGRIINVGSIGGLQGGEGTSAYGASKAGLINFTQSLAAEGKHYTITANAVIPGTIDTPANRQAMPQANFDEWVKPEALAQVILFLSSEEAQAITGATIPVLGKL
ncbi:SDR family oxidoreductase [candidate division KSB1 bacterium]|nr:SDR family oxidoreductase [candidate division KSB1 bacterium]